MTDSDEIYLRPVNPNCKCQWCAYLMSFENVCDKTRYCSFLDKYVSLDSLCPEFKCKHKYSENKRFKGLIGTDGTFKKVKDNYTDKELTIKECIDVMNKLNDKNKILSEDNDSLTKFVNKNLAELVKDLNIRIVELEKENSKLKEERWYGVKVEKNVNFKELDKNHNKYRQSLEELLDECDDIKLQSLMDYLSSNGGVDVND